MINSNPWYYLDADNNKKTPNVLHCYQCKRAYTDLADIVRVEMHPEHPWIRQSALGEHLIGPDCWRKILKEGRVPDPHEEKIASDEMRYGAELTIELCSSSLITDATITQSSSIAETRCGSGTLLIEWWKGESRECLSVSYGINYGRNTISISGEIPCMDRKFNRSLGEDAMFEEIIFDLSDVILGILERDNGRRVHVK